MVLAADRRQARTVFRYIDGLISNVPMLAELVERRTSEEIHLRNRISIEVHTASFRAVRGYTIVAAILDEIAFWRDESSVNPDEEILAAARAEAARANCANWKRRRKPSFSRRLESKGRSASRVRPL